MFLFLLFGGHLGCARFGKNKIISFPFSIMSFSPHEIRVLGTIAFLVVVYVVGFLIYEKTLK